MSENNTKKSILTAKNLNLSIGFKKILTDVSLGAETGEFIGILGGSGSGKSSLLRCLCSVWNPSKGTITIDGKSVEADENFKKYIGYVPQDDIVHRSLTVERALYYSFKLRCEESSLQNDSTEQINTVLNTLDLIGHEKKYISSLSGGQRKRVSIGVELLHQPRYFFLDEPTAGLDPALERQMMRLLKKLASENRLVLTTTHLMENIDLLDLILFIHKGYLIYFGPVSEIKGFFQVQSMVALYEKISCIDPLNLQVQYTQSIFYRDYVLKRIQGV